MWREEVLLKNEAVLRAAVLRPAMWGEGPAEMAAIAAPLWGKASLLLHGCCLFACVQFSKNSIEKQTFVSSVAASVDVEA